MLGCVELCCAVLYCIISYCIVYSVRESKSPAGSKNRTIRAKLALSRKVCMGDGGSG